MSNVELPLAAAAKPKAHAGEPNMSVTAIKEGTVIDHIQAGQAITLLRLFRMENAGLKVTVGLHLPSSKMGFKDIIKVEQWELTPLEASKIAIFSPSATINIIHNYRVADKYQVTLPPTIEQFIVCPNGNCVTNHEKGKRLFYVGSFKREVHLQCKYCEKAFLLSEIKEYEL